MTPPHGGRETPMTTTAEIVAAMLKENTGTHMLDSGFGNGRHWQQNAARNFEAEPEGAIHCSGRWGELWVTANLYHYATQKLRFAPTWQARFEAYCEKADNERRSTPWLELMGGFFDQLAEEGHKVTTPYGGDEGAMCVNSYNEENCLSQNVQLYVAEVDGEELYLVQVHGGADIRGGYTAPKAFTGASGSEWDFLRWTDTRLACDNCEAGWESYGGHNFEPDGNTDDVPPLDRNLPIFEAGVENEAGETRAEPGVGYLFKGEDGSVHCPCCGTGKLAGWFG